jgi:hypothetical protein
MCDVMEEDKNAESIGRLLESLELVTARMLEMIVVSSQVAAAQTPEMRELFNTWIKYISDEIERMFGSGRDISLEEISKTTGLSRESVLTLLAALDRRGKIAITRVTAAPGDGRNSEICDCMS